MTGRSARFPRLRTVAYGLVLLAACAQNFGLRIAIEPADLSFSEPIWQAGIGDAVIGALLLAARRSAR